MQLLLEVVKILNWTDKSHELRLKISWADTRQTLFDKAVKGELHQGCLRVKVPIKLQLVRSSQTLLVQLANTYGKPIGSAELTLEAGVKQKAHYLSIPNSSNKILQINVTMMSDAKSTPTKQPITKQTLKDIKQPKLKDPTPQQIKDVQDQCQRVVQQTLERKILTNIELKRNDIFIKNREKFLTEYSRSKSRSQTKDFPSKINNLLQEVRSIKNAIRVSSSRSSSGVISNRTPSRVSSLRSIEEKPRLANYSPKDSKRSPRRFESERHKYMPTSPDIYSEYGIIKTKVPGKQERPEREVYGIRPKIPEVKSRLQQDHHTKPRISSKEKVMDRPSYVIRKNYS